MQHGPSFGRGGGKSLADADPLGERSALDVKPPQRFWAPGKAGLQKLHGLRDTRA